MAPASDDHPNILGVDVISESDVHTHVCFLSLVLQKTLELGLVSHGLGRSTRKVLEELRGLKSMDVSLPTSQGEELKLKIVSEPDPALKILLDHLNLKYPKRLKPPSM